MTLEEAKLVLRIDTDFTDNQVQMLLDAVPGYIEDCTGLKPADQETEPLCKVLTQYLLIMWYEHDNYYEKTIESLLKTLKIKTQAAEKNQE